MYADEESDEAFKFMVEKYKPEIGEKEAAGLLQMYEVAEFELALEGLVRSLRKVNAQLDSQSKEKLQGIAKALGIPDPTESHS